jgi:hypothetical protein
MTTIPSLLRAILGTKYLSKAEREIVSDILRRYVDGEIFDSPGVMTGVEIADDAELTLVLSDIGKLISYDRATPSNVVIPNDSDVLFPEGVVITFEQAGVGEITITGDTGVEIRALDNGFTTPGQYSIIQITKTAPNKWLAVGGTT